MNFAFITIGLFILGIGCLMKLFEVVELKDTTTSVYVKWILWLGIYCVIIGIAGGLVIWIFTQ